MLDVNHILGSIPNLTIQTALRKLFRLIVAGPFVKITGDTTLRGNFFTKRVLIQSDIDTTVGLPAIQREYDGAEITFVKSSAIVLTIQAPGDVSISDTLPGGKIINSDLTQTWSTLTLKYFHELKVWYVIASDGTWVTENPT